MWYIAAPMKVLILSSLLVLLSGCADFGLGAPTHHPDAARRSNDEASGRDRERRQQGGPSSQTYTPGGFTPLH